jgi:hypothetical protein
MPPPTTLEDGRERLTEAQELVRTLDRTGQRVRRRLQDTMAIVSREVDLEASGKVAQLRRRYEAGIAEKGLDLADDLIAGLHEAQEELFEMLSQRLTTLVNELRDELEEGGVQLEVSATLPDRTSIEVSPSDPGRKGIDARDVLVVPLIAVVGVVTMNPFLIAGGVSAALIRGTQVFGRSRKERARKQLAQISTDFQRQLSFVLHQATVEARASLTDELEDALGSRRDDLLEEIRSLEMQRSSRRLAHRNLRLRDRC